MDNSSLYEAISSNQFLNLKSSQTYVPIYTRFFSLSDKNIDKVTLNNYYNITSISKMHDKNSCNANIVDPSGVLSNVDVFFKYSPLLDPMKYLIGKYDISDNSLLNLPYLGRKTCHAKCEDPNNSAYVDSFFTYLSSQLLHTHKFPHALDFYGSFLSRKINFQCNIADDIDYLNASSFFHDNKGILFEIDNIHVNELFNIDTRKKKETIAIANENDTSVILDLSDASEL